MFLIDSPLIQRLKSIKQLGYAYQVYCNADYSRFAHTVGVVEASTRMAKNISRELHKLPAEKDGKIDFIDIVRLAAIMHDSGHMFFSHVSEQFFNKNERFKRKQNITEALSFFNEKISDRASLHEMFSVMIINSEEFNRFLSIVYFEKSWNEEERKIVIDYISGLIVGVAVDKKILPFCRIIKGTIDADRMDFLSRDSYTTKVPLAVDIARLVNKISVIDRKVFYPSQVWNDDMSGPYYTMAIQYSAQRLVWQLSMTRTILYQNIYFHHKKLTAESILTKALEHIFSLFSDEQMSFTYIASLTDAVFSEYFYHILIPEIKRNESDFLEAQTLMLSLRNRSFYKRVASFSQETVISNNIEQYELFKTHVIENPFSAKYNSFIENLSSVYKNVLQLLGKASPTTEPKFMFIQAGWNWEAEEGIPIDLGDGEYKWSTELFKETPVIGEENKQKQYYLLTDQQNRDIVYLALEKALYSDKGFILNSAAYACAKLTSDQLNRIRKRLFEKSFYDGYLEILPDEILCTVYDNDVFKAVIQKYRSFIGADETVVTNETLKKYLRQFLYSKCSYTEIQDLLDGVLRLLNSAVFISRNYFRDNMSKLMDDILQKNYSEYYIVKLGGLFDSSNRLFWFFNEIKSSSKYKFADSVSDALRLSNKTNGCICFFDDGAYSGSQVISVFQELMGVNNRPTDESHVSELSDTDKELLKRSNIILSYICFNSLKREYVINELKKLGIVNVDIIYHKDLCDKVFDDTSRIFNSPEQRELVKNKLSEIGYEIIKSTKNSSRWNEARLQEAALGYNDAQQMVIFDVNVPTYTILSYWFNGKYNGINWRGLFQRTDNSQKTIKS